MKKITLGVAVLVSVANVSNAQMPTLEEYLAEMNFSEVSFSGHIKYDRSSLNDVDFVFYNSERKPFPVSVDAGRQARMEIESLCENSSFMNRLSEMCEISGTGTIEIRGSGIYLSIDEIEQLSAP